MCARCEILFEGNFYTVESFLSGGCNLRVNSIVSISMIRGILFGWIFILPRVYDQGDAIVQISMIRGMQFEGKMYG